MGLSIFTINYMVSSKFCKRLAASLLKCGKKRIKLNLCEKKKISNAISRKAISKLIENESITLRPINIHVRSRIRKRNEEKSRGLHKGKKIRKRRNASVSVLKTNKQSFNSNLAKDIQ